MRKVLFIALLFASALVQAQKVQDTFFGFKLGGDITADKIDKTLVTEYSRSLIYVNENPLLIGTAHDLNYAGCKWGDMNVVIFKPDMKFFGVEFIETGSVFSNLRSRYDMLLQMLTEKYGQPEEVETDYQRWTGKNGVSIELKYQILRPLPADEQDALREEGKEIPFSRLYLTYWDVKMEARAKQYNQDQL